MNKTIMIFKSNFLTREPDKNLLFGLLIIPDNDGSG